MTSYFPFSPVTSGPTPSFTPVLDGVQYRVTITWNLFGQRYYVNCYDTNGDRIFTVARVTTPPSKRINTIQWDVEQLLMTVTTLYPHGYALGSTLDLIIEDASPSSFNGAYRMLATGLNTLTFPCSLNPGNLVTPGNLSYFISLCKGYFQSTMIYRNGRFEVNP